MCFVLDYVIYLKISNIKDGYYHCILKNLYNLLFSTFTMRFFGIVKFLNSGVFITSEYYLT